MSNYDFFICPNCDNEMDDTIDGIHYQCGHCGFKLQFDKRTKKVIEDYSEVYEPNNSTEINPMCNACGNPDYPKCIDSCSRMDD